MTEPPAPFRDFGILPDGVQPPPPKTRSFLSRGRIVGQCIGTGLVVAIGIGLTVFVALILPLPLNLLGCAAVLASFGAFLYAVTNGDYRWIELEQNSLRAKHLYTGRIIERSLAEVESLHTMVYQSGRIETVIAEKLLGRVKGIEIRFRNRLMPLRVMRADPAMTNAQELIEAVLYRMRQIRELDAPIVDHAGQPLVKSIYWKGELPVASKGRNLGLIFGCLTALALLFGILLSYWGLQEREFQRLSSVPPHEIALSSLIEGGPGANRHVTLTDFRSGGYAYESNLGSWTNVWVALHPIGVQPDEIKVVLSSRAVRNEAALQTLLQDGRITGICSQSPRTGWGMTLGPNLEKANQGCRLTSAWSVDEMSEPPSEARVTGILAGSVACLAAAILLALIVFWKAA